MNPAIEGLLRPRAIAISAPRADFQKLNGRTLKALLDKGYAGEIYPVNPKYPHIAGLRCYSEVRSFLTGSTLAIVARTRAACAPAVTRAGARGRCWPPWCSVDSLLVLDEA